MRSGQLEQFKVVFEEFYSDMVKTAVFYVRDSVIAEDIVQEVFTKLWEKRSQLGDIENLKGYLIHATKNKSLNYLEHLQIVDQYQQNYLRNLQEEKEVNLEEDILLVRNLLEKLPPKRKIILEMSILETKSYQEISCQLDISINTVKDHIKIAYAFLRKEMNKNIPTTILYLALTHK